VVSLPRWALLEAQPKADRGPVLPPEIERRLAVEAASPLGWERYVGCKGRIFGVERFGASAPYPVIAQEFGFTADRIEQIARELLAAL